MKKEYTNEYLIGNDYIILKINNNKFGVFEIVIDINEFDFLKRFSWNINKFGKKNGAIRFYAYSYINKRLTFLHRLVTNAPKGKIVDHINRNSLDNRLDNLRVCDQSVNIMNRELLKSNKSGHKGVFWCNNLVTPKWKSKIEIRYKTIHLGYFDTYEEAVIAREQTEKQYWIDEERNSKEYYNDNFIKDNK